MRKSTRRLKLATETLLVLSTGDLAARLRGREAVEGPSAFQFTYCQNAEFPTWCACPVQPSGHVFC